ncbi:MAG: alpha/beta fold hydrolase [Verrucomicrobiota bacterium]
MIFLLLLLPVFLLLGCQSRLIYYPQPNHEGLHKTLAKQKGERVEYQTAQGKQVAFYIPPRSGAPGTPATLWLCFAGNGSLALHWLSMLRDWDPSFGYLLVDYPGYGDCQGKPSPSTIRESSRAAVMALATHLKVTGQELQPRLAVLGHSIGCAAGLMTAQDQQVKRIVLIAPFTTMTEMGRRVLGWPLCYLNLHRFDNRQALAAVSAQGAKVTIFHGTADEMIPVSMSRELAAACPTCVVLHEKPGQDHNFILGNCAEEIGAAMAAP